MGYSSSPPAHIFTGIPLTSTLSSTAIKRNLRPSIVRVSMRSRRSGLTFTSTSGVFTANFPEPVMAGTRIVVFSLAVLIGAKPERLHVFLVFLGKLREIFMELFC